MIRKVIKQNKTFLSIAIILFILFGLVLYFGSNQIYERETKWQYGNAVSQLLSAKEIIKGFFSDFVHDLLFLRDLPSTKGYVDSNFESINYRNRVEEIFYVFAKTHGYYYQIRIIDSSGRQVLWSAIDEFRLKQSFFIMGRNTCAYHHEKYNGKGYPEGLEGEEIPLEARIFALCDAYDAIRSKRPYKDELSHEEAVRRIQSDSGEHFDPDTVDAFLQCEKEFLKISNTYTS